MGYGKGKNILTDIVVGTGGAKTIKKGLSSSKGGSGSKSKGAPDYGESMESILRSQIELAPAVYASEAEYQPKYQALQAQIQAQSAWDQMSLYKELQPSYSGLEDAYTTATQQNQLRGLQERAPDYIQAFQRAQGTAGINNALQGYAENTLGSQLAAGFQLSPEEQRGINQQTLQGFAGRGTALGNQANLASVLNRYQYTQARQQQALQQASGIGSYLSQQSQPALASFYQQPMYASSAGGQSIANAIGSEQQAGPSLFNPESQTGMGSIYGAYNARMGLQGAQMQAAAAKSAGQNSMYGAIGGAAIGAAAVAACWVARACFGSVTDNWKQFRNTMFSKGSDRFISWYCRNGERLAAFIEKSNVAKFIGRLTLSGIKLKWNLQK